MSPVVLSGFVVSLTIVQITVVFPWLPVVLYTLHADVGQQQELLTGTVLCLSEAMLYMNAFISAVSVN